MQHVGAALLHAATLRALAPYDLDPAHAGWVADTLVETSLRGIDTHGIRLLETYVRELDGGRARARPQLRLHGTLPALALLDADAALGVVAANVAVDELVARARRCGIAGIAVCNSNHFGAAGHYTARAAAQDVLAFAFSNSDALVAPHAGMTALNGTNPLSMAAPGLGEDLFLLDMATSQVSYSKVMHCLESGAPLEPGWARDARGGDAAQTRSVETLQPLGGYKGQGLGMMVQILAAALTGMPYDHELSHLYTPPYDQPRRVGHCFIGIDLRALGAPEAFRRRVSTLLQTFRASRARGAEAVLVPGDPERQAREQRLRDGIPLGEREARFLEPYLRAASVAARFVPARAPGGPSTVSDARR